MTGERDHRPPPGSDSVGTPPGGDRDPAKGPSARSRDSAKGPSGRSRESAERPPGRGREVDFGPTGLDAIPGLAKVAAMAWFHTAEWALQNSAKAGARVLRAAVDPREAVDLARDTAEMAVQAAEGVGRAAPQSAAETAQTVAGAVPKPSMPSRRAAARDENGDLRAHGEALLRRSRDVRYEEDAHPAYERILGDLAPDEGRILRLLLLEGPQPAVDVRTGGPMGYFNSRLLAPGLNMIGARAGCRYVDRVPSYLNNLYRLGLIWFSRETLRDSLRYQVIEAQPDVLEAMHSIRFPKIVRRSIHLTPFGEDFCLVALALDAEDTLDERPIHSAPEDLDKAPQPPPPLD